MISSCHLFKVLLHFTCLHPSVWNLLGLLKHCEYFCQSKDKSNKNFCFDKVTVSWYCYSNNQYLIISVHDKALNVVYVLVSNGVSCPDEVDDFGKIVTVFSLFYFSKFIILRWPWNREKIKFSLFMYLKWYAHPFFISSLMTLIFVNSTSSFAGTTKNGSSCACSRGSTCLANIKWHE